MTKQKVLRRLFCVIELQSDAGLLSLLSSILETCNSQMRANDSATPPERALVCPDLSRVARVGSGRFKRNIHGLVPTVPSCPDQKTTASASPTLRATF